MLTLIVGTYIHISGLSFPRLSFITHAGLLISWLVGLGLITSKIGDMVLGHSCSTSLWVTDMGIMICRIYKALYSFIVIGTASLAAAAVLDFRVIREISNRGAYREMKDNDQGQGEKRGLGLGRSMSGMSARRSGFGLRGGNYVQMKESPELAGDDGDMGQRLVENTPDLRSPGMRSDEMSDYERTPRL